MAETKSVSLREFKEAEKQLLKEFSEATGMDGKDARSGIRFVFAECGCFFSSPRKMKLETCWRANGSIEPSEAMKFAKALAVAAELAESFKYNGYKFGSN